MSQTEFAFIITYSVTLRSQSLKHIERMQSWNFSSTVRNRVPTHNHNEKVRTKMFNLFNGSYSWDQQQSKINIQRNL